MDAYSVDFEEGEIREYAPAPIFSSIAPRRCSRYYDRDDDDDESIRSSRPCTPPSQGMSVPGAPGPKPTLSRVVATTLPLPSPPPQGRRGGVSTTSSSAAVAGATLDGRDAARWTIPPDVYRKAESALARITSMSRGRSSAHSASDHGLSSAHSASDHGLSSAVGPPTGTHRYSPEQGALGPTTVGYGNSYSYASSASLENHREPPRSPRKSLSFFGRASLTCLIDACAILLRVLHMHAGAYCCECGPTLTPMHIHPFITACFVFVDDKKCRRKSLSGLSGLSKNYR